MTKLKWPTMHLQAHPDGMYLKTSDLLDYLSTYAQSYDEHIPNVTSEKGVEQLKAGAATIRALQNDIANAIARAR